MTKDCTCGNCFFHRNEYYWYAYYGAPPEDVVDCCRYPKKVTKRPTDWCGEYKAQKGE